jgi:hypothetical protein
MSQAHVGIPNDYKQAIPVALSFFARFPPRKLGFDYLLGLVSLLLRGGGGGVREGRGPEYYENKQGTR